MVGLSEKDQSTAENDPISKTLSENKNKIKAYFENCHDLTIIDWQYGPEMGHTAFSVFFDSLIQQKKVNFMKQSLQDLVTHEVGPGTTVTPADVMRFFGSHGVSAQSAKLVDNFTDVLNQVVDGNLVIFFNDWNKALSYKATGLEGRQVTEAITEPVVFGPREGTIENLSKNIGLLRSRLKSPKFKIETFSCGQNSKTDVSFGYLEGKVNPDTLAEFKKRIAGIENEDILETSYVDEWIQDSDYSPFPQCRYTERPDTAVANLLEGKIVVLVDGTPSMMICPALFVEFLTHSEDYYQRTVHASMIRFLRVIAFVLALTLPSTYIAFSTFHPELMPSVLLLTLLETREGIPFPALVEALIMEFFFELLREAGIRLPRPIGSAVSIVGALVIGQAAIEAKIASPVMVIVVALTGIASFAIPQYNIAVALRILRFPLMILAGSMGFFGLMTGFLLIFLHLSCLKSLSVPYLSGLAPFDPRQFRDVFVRVNLKTLLRYPRKMGSYKRSNR